MLIGLLALGVRFYAAHQRGIWTGPLVPVAGEANQTAVNLACGLGYATPFLQLTNMPPQARRLLPRTSPQGHPLLVVSGKLPPSAHSAPGYIFTLAGMIKVAVALGLDPNAPYRAMSLLALLLSVGSIVVWTWFAGESFGAPAEWCAGLLLSLWPRLVRSSWALWDTPFTLFGLSLCFLFMVLWKNRPSFRSFIAYGMFAGILTLFNPIAAPVAGITLIAGVWGRLPSERRLPVFATAVGVWVVCLLPWTARNAIEFGRFVPIRNNFGFEMWVGTLAECDGTSESGMCRHPMEVRSEQQLIESVGEGRYMQLRAREALQTIREKPENFAARTLKRIRLYWCGNPPFSGSAEENRLPWFRQPVWIMFFADLVRLGCAVAGLLAFRDRPTRWTFAAALVLLPLPYYVTHVCANYRIFLEPFLLLLFTGFVVSLLGRWRRKQDESSVIQATQA